MLRREVVTGADRRAQAVGRALVVVGALLFTSAALSFVRCVIEPVPRAVRAIVAPRLDDLDDDARASSGDPTILLARPYCCETSLSEAP